jgi:hypothetical protein
MTRSPVVHLVVEVVAVAALLALAVPAVAQSSAISSPKGYVTKEGEQYSAFFGAYAVSRYQIGDGHQRGSKLSVTQLSLRHDCWNYDLDHGGLGRSWTRVTLAMSDTDLSKFQTTFTLNAVTTPTTMFSGQIKWPTFVGLPKNCPAPLGDGGTNDLLSDFTFEGGTLANGKSWGTSAIFYYLDSANQGTKTGMRLRFLGSKSCKDSSQTSAALCRIGAEVQSSGTGNTVTFSLGSQWTAPNRAVIKTIGIAGSLKGTDIGACNKLYTTPIFYDFATALPGFAFSFTFFPAVIWNNSFAGIPLWAQAAWQDSSTKAFRLTRATTGRIPMQPAPSTKLCAVERPQLISTGNKQDNHIYLPLVFYN